VASGDGAAGLNVLQDWIRRNPKDVQAVQALAEAHLRSGNLKAARSAYEGLARQRPDDAGVLNNLAHLLALEGDPAALEYAERAHRNAPLDAAIQDTLGWLLVQRNELEAGLRHLREARLRDPQNPEIRYHLATALARAGRSEEARRELDEALKSRVAFDEREAAVALMSRLQNQ
jgi:Flp pilus assembly protein TadD